MESQCSSSRQALEEIFEFQNFEQRAGPTVKNWQLPSERLTFDGNQLVFPCWEQPDCSTSRVQIQGRSTNRVRKQRSINVIELQTQRGVSVHCGTNL